MSTGCWRKSITEKTNNWLRVHLPQLPSSAKKRRMIKAMRPRHPLPEKL